MAHHKGDLAMEKTTRDRGIRYISEGEGIPLVLLHGFPLAAGMWQPQIKALAHACHLLVPNLPGFGGSKLLEGNPTIEGMADAIAAFLEDLHMQMPVVLCGLSMGGYVAMGLVRRNPGMVHGLILADTRAEPDSAEAKAGRAKTIAFAKANPPGAVFEQMIPKLFRPDTIANQPQLIDEMRQIAKAQTIEGVAAGLQALRDRRDASTDLHMVAAPTLVLVGRDDVLTPVANAEKLAAAIKGAKLEVLDGAAHLSNLEQPDRFNAAVKSFLKRVS
jgi:pimeloyl-ACP methyl ester carboxylesterase